MLMKVEFVIFLFFGFILANKHTPGRAHRRCNIQHLAQTPKSEPMIIKAVFMSLGFNI
jgi:hypothetical protein